MRHNVVIEPSEEGMAVSVPGLSFAGDDGTGGVGQYRRREPRVFGRSGPGGS